MFIYSQLDVGQAILLGDNSCCLTAKTVKGWVGLTWLFRLDLTMEFG
jgi:hypothetical protein